MMTFKFIPMGFSPILVFYPIGLLPYMVFMGEICDLKVLHYVVKPPRLLFDPLYAKFFP